MSAIEKNLYYFYYLYYLYYFCIFYHTYHLILDRTYYIENKVRKDRAREI